MALFHVRIMASNKTFFNGDVQMVVLPALDGECGIMARHENEVISIQPGELRVQDSEGKWHYAAVGSGFAQMANNRLIVLVDTAERPEDIDETRARAALGRAKEELRQQQSIQEYYRTQAVLARAISRLKEKNRSHINL